MKFSRKINPEYKTLQTFALKKGLEKMKLTLKN